MKNILVIGAVAAALAGCAAAPQRSDRLEAARTEVQTLAQDPLAPQAASKDLEQARRRLQQADVALEQKQSPAVIDHLAYLAQRHAESGEARVQEARSRQEIARAEEQRQRVLLEARSRDVEAAKAQADVAQAQLAATQAQLADLKAKQTDRGVVVTLGDVLFDSGRATLKPGADLSLDRLAAYMKTNPQARVLIEGHTDNRGSDDYNDALSERRADAVAAALTRRGVLADNVKAVGRGKGYPVATNDSPEGRQQNRRVEIIFSDSSGRFAQSAADQPVQR